ATPLYNFQADADNAAAKNSGWTPWGVGTSFYYRSGIFSGSIANLSVGALVTVEAIVTDCGATAHGGFAFVDNFKIQSCPCTAPPDSMVAWWPFDGTSSTAPDIVQG